MPMESNGSPQPSVPVLASCPDCERPNYAGQRWCTACGCLLIGYDPPHYDNAQLHNYNVPRSINNALGYPASQYNQGSNHVPNFTSSMQPRGFNMSHSFCEPLGFAYQHETQASSNQNGAPSSFNPGFGYSGSFYGPSAQGNVRPARYRCISGPSEQDAFPSAQLSNPFLSDSDLTEALRTAGPGPIHPEHNFVVASEFPDCPVVGPYDCAPNENVDQLSNAFMSFRTTDEPRQYAESSPHQPNGRHFNQLAPVNGNYKSPGSAQRQLHHQKNRFNGRRGGWNNPGRGGNRRRPRHYQPNWYDNCFFYTFQNLLLTIWMKMA